MHIDEVFFPYQYSDIPTKVVTSGKSWLTGQNSSEKVQMRCYRGVREKVLYSVTWEEDSQNISLKTEKNDERSFFPNSWIFEENILVQTYTRRIFFLPELDRQGQRSLFHTKSLILRILFASSCFGEFHFLNFSKNIYGLGRMFH